MLYLLISVVLTCSLFVGFKFLGQKNVNLLMAIVGNYLACILTAAIINKGYAFANFDSKTMLLCMALGVLFFIVFYAMGYAANHIGVGISGASSKMSLVIPVLYGVLFMNETFNIGKIIALFLALIAVVLISYQSKEPFKIQRMGLPFLIFIGSGIIDTALNVLQIHFEKQAINKETAIAIIFFGALISALIFILKTNKYLLKDTKSIIYGIFLGVPNYLSVYFMVLALQSNFLESNQFYMINNTAVMLLSFIAALFLFKEELNKIKVLGIILAVTAIYLSLV